MNPIGSMIIIGTIALAGSIGIVAAVKHLGTSSPKNSIRKMKIVPFEEIAEAHGDWVTTSAEFPKSGVLREPNPRGM